MERETSGDAESESSAQLPPPSCPRHVDADVASFQSLAAFHATSTLVDSKDFVALVGTFPPSPSPAVLTVKPPRLTANALLSALPTTAVTLRHSNSLYHSFISALLPCHVDVAYPAPARLIERLSTASSSLLVTETAADYAAVHLPYLTSLLADPQHAAWVWNIVEGKSEVDRVLLSSPASPLPFTLVAHPEWDMAQGVGGLHAFAIVHDRRLRSLRDLTGEHLPLLRELRRAVVVALRKRFAVEEEGLVCFLHYPPSYYQLHVHVMGLNVDKGFTAAINKAVDLFEVEQQLSRDPAWYQHCDIRCRLPLTHPLAKAKGTSIQQ